MGPVWWKTMFLLHSTDVKIWSNVFFLPPFNETSEALYNKIWVIDWATTDNDPLYTRWLIWCTAGTQHTRASTSTDGEGEDQSITLPAISRACVVAAQRQLAALHRQNKFVSSRGWIERDDQNVLFCWLDYDRRKQLMLLESERSLRERELLAGPATSLTQFPKRCRIPFDRPTRRGALLLVPWSSNPSSVVIFLMIPPC